MKPLESATRCVQYLPNSNESNDGNVQLETYSVYFHPLALIYFHHIINNTSLHILFPKSNITLKHKVI